MENELPFIGYILQFIYFNILCQILSNLLGSQIGTFTKKENDKLLFKKILKNL